MIEPFFGEFLIHPAPLDATLNYCSHKCAYCFANLNHPKRRYAEAKTYRLLNDLDQRQGLAAALLRDRYPVVLSNRVDPFAATNYRQSIPLLEHLLSRMIPVTIQTRGGRGVEQALRFMRPAVWYVSIPFLSEDLRQRIEPGAPPIEERLDLIKKLVMLGHSVNVGINPLVPEWQPDPAPLMQAVATAGAWGVWIERLHLNRRQVSRMSDTERQNMGAAVLQRAQQYKSSQLDLDHFHRARATAVDAGLQIYSHGQPNPSRFWEPFERLYPQRFPTVQGWINHLAHTGQNAASFDEFAAYMTPRLPAGDLPLGYYLGATSRDIFRRRDVPRVMAYEQLLELIWTDPRTKYSLVRSPAFAFVKDGGRQAVDTAGRPWVAYSRQGFNDFWLNVS